MKELKVIDLSKTYGTKDIFNQISFIIRTNDRIGLIGVNGTGKTSLLSILSGREKGDGDRQAVFYPKDYRVAYLEQDNIIGEELTVLEAVFQGENEQVKIVRRYEKALLELQLSGDDPAIQKEFEHAQEAMTEHDAWLTDTNAKIILQRLGIQELDKKMKELSGGQKKRVGLAQVLIDEPDLLLLDEPTNHLDYQTIEWLEGYLKQYRGSLVMVTHDRYFLDRVSNRIFELAFGQLHEYKGNYEEYLIARSERERVEEDQEGKRKQLFKQELAWMRAGAKARTTKQQARIGRFEELKENLHQVKRTGDIEIDIASQRLGKQVLEIKNGDFTIGQQAILTNFDLLIQANERLGITGENGAGKSTLLNILAQRLPLDHGTLIVGETVRLAYYTQQNEEMNPETRMIAYLQEAAEAVSRKDGSQISVAELLERFLFPRHSHGTKIGKLSGGEKRRLYLLKLLVGQPNVLLLDEPTNDLDIDTLTILEDYLHSFPGAVITVSHDRYFLDKVAEKLLIFEGNAQIRSYYGSINDYLRESSSEEQLKMIAKKEMIQIVEPKKEKQKLSYMEQKEWETIEDDIAGLEAKIETLTEEMNHQGSNFTELQKIQTAISEVEAQLEEKMNRWEYLSEWAD
ncbi:MAG: ABC-F family ATP-binding cassette domain-containing protein [Enterococcus aquimarinus]